MILPIVQPLYFNITSFNDTESASLIGYAGIAKTENGTLVLNPLINNGVGRAIYGKPLRLKNSSNGHVTDFSTWFSFTIDVSTRTNYGDGFAFFVAPLAYQIPPNSEFLSWCPIHDAKLAMTGGLIPFRCFLQSGTNYFRETQS
ncbi:L-type lectin-domain containing receptor kinase IX.1 [Glycine soja]|uniref:L-type lectin-domain containing receptor kinase IX.1 n=1 Tax=Glycine soja TaxID=3848 RepID=A0A0B2P9P6_GLYSO|nr:L-type lectin-domain containing receptor kinase IX.1 [Glycine soja]